MQVGVKNHPQVGALARNFAEMTERLLALETSRQGATVYVQPQVVVEVLFNELQESSNYQSGLALRFARVKRYRHDNGDGGSASRILSSCKEWTC